MEMGNHRILDLELDRRLGLYQEDILRLKVKAAELKSHVSYTTGPSLMKDLREMVNNEQCSDVIFVCQDGERVQASRMSLVARSEVFRSLLSNGMAETEQSEVALPEVSSDVFLLILDFLYTAQLWEEDLKLLSLVPDKDAQAHHYGLDQHVHAIKFPPFSLDWLFMFRAIKAAQFLLLDELECVLITRVWLDLPRQVQVYSEEILNQITQRFTLVCGFVAEVHDVVSERYLSIIGLHLLKIMSEHDLSVTHLRNLSYEALVSYMNHTKNYSKDETWRLSFREYVRLWQLITWCNVSTTEISDSSREASILWFPDPKRAASFLMNYEEQKGFFLQPPSHVLELRQQFSSKILQRDHFEELKGMIDLVHIHPELLIHVVEPLGIFSPTELGAVLKDQLLRASRWRKQVHSLASRCAWQVVHAGKIRMITDDRLGSEKLAVANAGMWCDSVYEWEIVHLIEYQDNSTLPRSCPSFTLEVGFLSLESRETMEDFSLSESEWGWAFKLWKETKQETVRCMFFENGAREATSLEGFVCMESEAIGPPSTVSDKCGVKWAIHVRLRLDRVKNTCSLSHSHPGGKEYSVHVECNNLSRGLLFPAVYVIYDEKCESETHIKLYEGFELSF